MSPRSEHPTDVGSSRRVPVSRRRVIGAGALATLGAGILGAAGIPAMSAAPLAVTLEQLIAASSLTLRQKLSGDALTALERFDAISWAMPDLVTPDDTRLQNGISPEMYELHARMMRDLEQKVERFFDWRVVEIRRHLPLLANVIEAVLLHVEEMDFDDAGVCCMGERS